MLLINKTKTIIQIGEVNRENNVGSTTLIPIIGTLEIEEARWAKIKKDNKVIAAMIEEGMLEESKGSPELALSEMSTNDAVYIVQAAVDQGLLNKWKSKEKRKPVLSAISAQLKRLTNTASKSESDDSDVE